ncbi:MAG: nucleotidyltransferase substrate binding protein [Clostridia bacterium]|nr:nucleotidyltransferase substrate binding protein [Clostridia bacterium]
MERFEQRKKDLMNVFGRLKEGLTKGDDDLYIDGILQRFEFTFELAWKTMKDYLEYLGVIDKIGSPREVIQSAFKSNLIEDGETWIAMMISRNELSHIYDATESRIIYNRIKGEYVGLIEKLLNKLS